MSPADNNLFKIEVAPIRNVPTLFKLFSRYGVGERWMQVGYYDEKDLKNLQFILETFFADKQK